MTDLCASALLEGKARYLKVLRRPKMLLEQEGPRSDSIVSSVLRALQAKGIERAPNVDDIEFAVSSLMDEGGQPDQLLRWTIREIARRLPGGQTTARIRMPYERRLLEDIARAASAPSWQLSSRLYNANATVAGLLETVRRSAYDQLHGEHSDEVLAILLGFENSQALEGWRSNNEVERKV
jgi:hypothetical protein